MVEINLLPEELKNTRRSKGKSDYVNADPEKVPLAKIALIASGIFVVIQAAVFGFGIRCGIIFGSLEKNYKNIAPARQEAERLKSKISGMTKKISAIDELMVKRFSWAKKLNDLSDSVTPGIWLTQLDYDEKLIERPRRVYAQKGKEAEGKQGTEKVLERHLIISGAASSMGEEGTALIGRFIEKLKENPSFYSDFEDIELGEIKREQMSGQEMMTFRITCLFKIK